MWSSSVWEGLLNSWLYDKSCDANSGLSSILEPASSIVTLAAMLEIMHFEHWRLCIEFPVIFLSTLNILERMKWNFPFKVVILLPAGFAAPRTLPPGAATTLDPQLCPWMGGCCNVIAEDYSASEYDVMLIGGLYQIVQNMVRSCGHGTRYSHCHFE